MMHVSIKVHEIIFKRLEVMVRTSKYVTDGRTDVRTYVHCHTIIRPHFKKNGRIKMGKTEMVELNV